MTVTISRSRHGKPRTPPNYPNVVKELLAMRTVEFEADVKDGSIEIPPEYRELVGGSVHVTLSSRASDREISLTILDQWLASPIRVPDFQPLGREQAHER